MSDPQERYLYDPQFNRLVDMLSNLMVNNEFDINEICEALTLAVHKVVEYRMKIVMLNSKGAEEWFARHNVKQNES